jgi:hypothetical protein
MFSCNKVKMKERSTEIVLRQNQKIDSTPKDNTALMRAKAFALRILGHADNDDVFDFATFSLRLANLEAEFSSIQSMDRFKEITRELDTLISSFSKRKELFINEVLVKVSQKYQETLEIRKGIIASRADLVADLKTDTPPMIAEQVQAFIVALDQEIKELDQIIVSITAQAGILIEYFNKIEEFETAYRTFTGNITIYNDFDSRMTTIRDQMNSANLNIRAAQNILTAGVQKFLPELSDITIAARNTAQLLANIDLPVFLPPAPGDLSDELSLQIDETRAISQTTDETWAKVNGIIESASSPTKTNLIVHPNRSFHTMGSLSESQLGFISDFLDKNYAQSVKLLDAFNRDFMFKLGRVVTFRRNDCKIPSKKQVLAAILRKAGPKEIEILQKCPDFTLLIVPVTSPKRLIEGLNNPRFTMIRGQKQANIDTYCMKKIEESSKIPTLTEDRIIGYQFVITEGNHYSMPPNTYNSVLSIDNSTRINQFEEIHSSTNFQGQTFAGQTMLQLKWESEGLIGDNLNIHNCTCTMLNGELDKAYYSEEKDNPIIIIWSAWDTCRFVLRISHRRETTTYLRIRRTLRGDI